MHKILIIEDDLIIAKAIAEHLEKWDYKALYITDFKDVLANVINVAPQLILMDISLPFFNGFHWCNEIRKISKVPIIFISSANDNLNIVMAMNMGADDFISKPFDLTVLTAKITAILRRTYTFNTSINILEHNKVILNLNDATVTYNDKKIILTKNDFKILQILLENATKVVSRDDLMIRLWESENFIDDNTLTVNITRLRKKLSDIGLDNFIVTKKGIGYIIL